MFFRIFLLLFLINLSTCNEDEQRLYADLLNNYNPLERPVENSSEPLIVKVRLFLQQIIDVDEKNQMVQVNAWIRYIWEDYKLKWNPDDYGGIRDVRFPGNLEQIWKPDVLLYNSADQNFDTTFKSNQLVYHTGEVNWIPPGILKFTYNSADQNFDTTFKSNQLVYHTGEVNWIPPGILKFTCPMVITWFPFDDQVCRLKFGSWTYHGFALDLQVDSDDPNSAHQMDLSDYVINGEWNLLASPAIREVSFYKCCPEPYPTIIFSMHIRRRTLFYWFNLIIPSLLVSMMTIFSFSFPPDAGEKMNLGEF
uniref:Neurotransmitter-gated ion-channel ligand-binding domain-containing protein n=1 Tax=Panagrolaimus sp. JU765 TaxID=591449 RepID=A0AC34RKQ2_9BILA